MNTLDYAKAIINEEIEALENLKSYLNNDFEKIVDYILNHSSKVVICGIGKSADIGRKIVATLNSTGTYAVFLHAADAMHGDLGIVQKDDLVIIISKSGSSAEIVTLLPFIKKLGNEVVAMVGNSNSILAKQAKWILNTTVKKEACPNNLAPTNSTTCQLVMGDALALTLMKKRNFTQEDFAKFHPGGALGKKLLTTVKEIMASTNNTFPFVHEETSLKEIILAISKGRLGATVVLNEQKNICGIITDGDIRRTLENKEDIFNLTATTIMNKNPTVIQENIRASEALNIMNNKNISQLLVANNNTYLGIIHIHDILKEGIE